MKIYFLWVGYWNMKLLSLSKNPRCYGFHTKITKTTTNISQTSVRRNQTNRTTSLLHQHRNSDRVGFLFLLLWLCAHLIFFLVSSRFQSETVIKRRMGVKELFKLLEHRTSEAVLSSPPLQLHVCTTNRLTNWSFYCCVLLFLCEFLLSFLFLVDRGKIATCLQV